MASAVLHAELRFRDGQRRTIQVQTQDQRHLSSLIHAMREVSRGVTSLLTELVQQEQGLGARAAASQEDEEDEEEEEDDEEDEEEEEDPEPNPKRTKT